MSTNTQHPTNPPRAVADWQARVTRGKLVRPHRVLIYGGEGIGKSTFAAGAPAPIFIAAEDGTDLLDVDRFPKPPGAVAWDWPAILAAIHTLATTEHGYKTLVIDTLDAAEPILWSSMMAADDTPNHPLRTIEDYGYGKGYQKALDGWRVFIAALERLRVAKGMNVILTAHAWIKPFRNPEGDDYDRYEMKLNAKAGGLLKEWVDAVLFAAFETYAHKDQKTKRIRGVSTGARIAYTQRQAAFDAKNRYGLPESIPLAWADFEAAATAGEPASPALLRAEIVRKAKAIGGTIQKQATELLANAGDDATRLALINNRLTARLAEKEQEGT